MWSIFNLSQPDFFSKSQAIKLFASYLDATCISVISYIFMRSKITCYTFSDILSEQECLENSVVSR